MSICWLVGCLVGLSTITKRSGSYTSMLLSEHLFYPNQEFPLQNNWWSWTWTGQEVLCWCDLFSIYPVHPIYLSPSREVVVVVVQGWEKEEKFFHLGIVYVYICCVALWEAGMGSFGPSFRASMGPCLLIFSGHSSLLLFQTSNRLLDMRTTCDALWLPMPYETDHPLCLPVVCAVHRGRPAAWQILPVFLLDPFYNKCSDRGLKE